MVLISDIPVKQESPQAPHGGQEWRHLSNFVNDFSVTTNSQAPPEKALEEAKKALDLMEHYPAQDFEPALTDLSEFLATGSKEKKDDIHSRLILGNGASELIDLVARLAPEGSWKPGASVVQYMEYERAAKCYLRPKMQWNDKSARLTLMVNPCNPTGDFLDIAAMRVYIENNCGDGSWIAVDESMLPWIGPNWVKESLISQSEWIKNLKETRDISVFVIHSWTKLWSCPGVRLGSILCPTVEDCIAFKSVQVPWSVNCSALAFLSAAVRDRDYLDFTWEKTAKYRANLTNLISKAFPNWKIQGESWSSWLWIETGSEETANKAVKSCKAAGVPIRSGKPGYNMPTFIRIGVRDIKYHDILLRALTSS